MREEKNRKGERERERKREDFRPKKKETKITAPCTARQKTPLTFTEMLKSLK